MQKIFLETERLILKYMSESEFDDLADMLKNSRVMYAWEYNFEDIDVLAWIKKNRELYKKYNMGYFLLEDKTLNKVVGQAALMPDVIEDKEYLEIGYILKEEYWHCGYAYEAAMALINYVFKELKQDCVIFEIRPENKSSRKVAEKIGAKIEGSFIKNVRGKQMEHLIYKLFMIN